MLTQKQKTACRIDGISSREICFARVTYHDSYGCMRLDVAKIMTSGKDNARVLLRDGRSEIIAWEVIRDCLNRNRPIKI